MQDCNAFSTLYQSAILNNHGVVNCAWIQQNKIIFSI